MNLKLAPKLTLVFVLFAALLLIGVGALSYSSGQRALEAATITELESIASEKEAALRGWILEREATIAALASSPYLLEELAKLLEAGPESTAANDRLIQDLSVHTGAGQSFLTLFILSESGQILVSTGPDEEGDLRAERNYFTEGETGTYTTAIYYSLELQVPAMTTAAPLRSQNGKLLGVLAGRLNLAELNEIIQRRSGSRDTNDAFLVNSSNLFITQPRFIPDPAVLQAGTHTIPVQRCLEGKSGTTFAEDHQGVPVIAVYRWLPQHQMCLIVEMERAEALAPMQTFQRTVGWIALATLAAAAVIAMVLSRTIVRPILAMQIAAQRCGQGDLGMRLPERRQDELGILAHEFNQMAVSLAEKEVELRAHAQKLEQKVQERTQALQESHSQFQRAEQIGQIGSWEWQLPDNRVIWSDGLYKVLGLAAQEFGATYEAYLQQVHPDDREHVRQVVNEAFNTGGAFEIENRIVRRDGQVRHLHTRGEMVFSEQGRAARMMGIAIDITESRQAQEALRQSEEKHQNFIRHSSSMFYTHTPDHVLIYVSPQAREVLDCEPEAAMVRWQEFLSDHPSNCQGIEATERAIQTGQRQPPYELELITCKGRRIWVQVDESPVVRDGKTIAIVGSITDITGRRRAEEALRESEENYRQLFEAESDAIFLIENETGRILQANNAACVLYGYSRDELLAKKNTDLSSEPEQTRQVTNETPVLSDQVVTIPLRLHRKKDGTVFPVEITGRFFVHQGRPVHLAAIRDITERKRAEEALRDSEEHYRTLFESNPQPMWVYDLETLQFLAVNDAAVEHYGYSRGEFLSMTIKDIRPAEDVSALLDSLAEAQQALHAPSIWRHRKKDGRLIDVEISSHAVQWNDRPARLALSNDITKRKKAEEALREKERLLSEAQRIGHIGSWSYSIATDVLQYSDEMYRLFDVSPDKFEHNSDAFLNLVYSSDRPLVEKWMEDIRGHGEAKEIEFLILRENGELCYLRCGGTVEFDKTGKSIRFTGTAQDVTERKLAELQIRQQIERLTALREVDRAISSSFDLNVTLDILLSQLLSQLHVDAADVLLLDPDAQILIYTAGRGFRTNALAQAPLRMTASQAMRERRPIHVQSLENKPDARLLTPLGGSEAFVCYFGVPLIVKGKIKGLLEVFHRAPLYPYVEWLDFLNTLAGQAAIAIENATLFENLEKTNRELSQAYDATIEGWSRALDLRDKETEGHTLRVTEMTLNLARAFGLSEQELLYVRWGALLHDIGKMGVPDHILLKEGPLTEDEWVRMKSHPQYAYDLLKPIAFLAPALDIPSCHHEKWDGTGYPRGLKGQEIPLVARLFAVVDVWDALRSDRPYRNAWSLEKAREYICEQAGVYFDPKVVELFLDMIKE